jgi:predicted HD phosphohydrolase
VVWSTSTDPGLHAVHGAVLAESDLADVVVVADAHHHELGSFGRLGSASAPRVAVLDDPLERRGGGAVVHDDLVPRLREMAGHRATHHPQPEKRHTCHGVESGRTYFLTTFFSAFSGLSTPLASASSR